MPTLQLILLNHSQDRGRKNGKSIKMKGEHIPSPRTLKDKKKSSLLGADLTSYFIMAAAAFYESLLGQQQQQP